MKPRSWGVVAVAVMIGAACSGDAEQEPATSAGGAAPGSGGGGSSSSQDEGGSSGGSECGAGAVNFDDPCEVCIATECTAEALACCEHEGCLEVVRCAAENGCSGVDCYAPDKCQAEIDAAGIDVASEYAAALGECAMASCQMQCLPEGGGGSGGAG
jgi:hypothetical protein